MFKVRLANELGSMETVFTEGNEGINPSNRQTVSSHQDNTDTFLCGVKCSTALQKLAPKLVDQQAASHEAPILKKKKWRKRE